jgi:signal transduction histidine kinase
LKGDNLDSKPSKILNYGFAIAATALALIFRQFLTPLWGARLPFLTFFPAVMLSSWYGGIRPGLFATALSTFSIWYFFVIPNNAERLPLPDAVALLLFTWIALLIVFLYEKLHRAVKHAESQAALLQESEERMRDAERQKDEFLAMVCHELRTPLNNLSSGTYLLRSRGTDELIRIRAIDTVERQVRNMSHIVSDLMDISRIGRKKLQLIIERLDLNDVIKETTEDLCDGLTKNLEVAFEAPRGPVWVDADRTRLAQMLTNLLQNAAKFTNSGGQIRVRVGTRDPNKVTVTVADTGAGIDAELLPRLFDAYTQGGSTHTSSEAGLGLGLAIVKSLAELHGGSVEAFSRGKGQGSEFRFSLPTTQKHSSDRSGARETTIVASKSASARN